MFREVPLSRSLRLAFGGGLTGMAMIASPAFAQTSSLSDVSVQQGERVEVTGSSIKRIDAESALPVTVLTRQDIDRLAPQNVEDLLKTISATSSLGSTRLASASGAATSTVSTVSLRGLGERRTLVLVNGRRIAPFGGVQGGSGGAAVDVNSIPLAAIERIEVLRDGASAIYGSDAIAGVVNFILRSDYQGGLAEATYGQSTHAGTGASYQSDVVVGFGDLQKDRFNAMLTASYNKESQVYGRDRYFANNTVNATEGNADISGNTFPASIVNAAGGARNFNAPLYAGVYGSGNCSPGIPSPAFTTGVTTAARNCSYDPASEVTLIPSSTRTAAGFQGQFAITPDIQAYTELNGTRAINKYAIQGNPISDQFALVATNAYTPQLAALINSYKPTLAYSPAFVAGLYGHDTFLLPTTSPYYPTAFAASQGLAGSPIDLRYRTEQLGGRETRDEITASRYLAGLKGTAAGWDFDAGALYSRSEVKESVLQGFPLFSKFLPLLNSGVVNPFGANTPAVQAQLLATTYVGEAFRSNSSFEQFDVRASREVLQLPAGPLSVAFGGDVRREHYVFIAQPAIQTGDVAGYGGNFLNTDAQRDTEAAFAEINVPIIKGLEADAAVRYDKYNGIANTVNPKASIRWQPVREFLVRASIGTGFRAPSLDELYAPVTQGVTGTLNDPLRCPTTKSSNDCGTQFTTINGGSTSLRPEKSVSGSLGFQLEPTANTHFGVDYFDTKLRHQIVVGGVAAGDILADLDKYAYLVTRGPASNGLPGQIVLISQQNTNLNNLHVDGLDFDARLRVPLDAAGKLTFALNGTYFLRYDVQSDDGSYTGGIANADTIGGVVPRWRHVAQATWDFGPWSGTLTDNFQSGYQDFDSNYLGNMRKVGAYETFDVQGSYSGIKNLVMTIGIKNFMDKDPPYSNVGADGPFQQGYDASYADPRGRFIYAKLSYKFL